MKGNVKKMGAATGEAVDQISHEDRCRIAGSLVERAFPEVATPLTTAQREQLQAALAAGGGAPAPFGSASATALRPAPRRRRFLSLPVPGTLGLGGAALR